MRQPCGTLIRNWRDSGWPGASWTSKVAVLSAERKTWRGPPSLKAAGVAAGVTGPQNVGGFSRAHAEERELTMKRALRVF
jgi:hypothetical protein